MLGTAVQERINVKMRELDAWRQYSIGDPEIGRKELILDGWSTGAVLGTTLVPALSLARALGDEQDASGTSFLTPPERVLGEPLFSPHLNLSIVTGGTQFGRMQWDDDGVAPRAAPLIMRGTVVDYLCSRANVETLHEWYAKQGRSLQPQGVERAESPTAVPMTCAGAVAMDAVATGPTVDEMVKSVKDGVLVRGGWASADQQHSSGIVMPTLLFAIRNGRITHRLVGATVEFSTKKLWKELVAIGHPSTAETTLNGQYGGVPIAPTMHTVTAPAVHIHEANVFSPL
jgi:TldD protein